MGKYCELIKKLENLEGPDREIDLEVLNALAPHESGDVWVWGAESVPSARHLFAMLSTTESLYEERGDVQEFHEFLQTYGRKVPAVTANINAAIALAREAYPKTVFTINDYPEKGTAAVALNRHEFDVCCGEGSGQNSAIAACIAALRAKKEADAHAQ